MPRGRGHPFFATPITRPNHVAAECNSLCLWPCRGVRRAGAALIMVLMSALAPLPKVDGRHRNHALAAARRARAVELVTQGMT